MKTVLLAEFNRDYHTHDLFGDHFMQAFENFLRDVKRWQASTGIDFECELISEKNNYLMCNVSKVIAKFETDTDYALYKLSMPVEKIATDVTGIDGEFHFTGWRDKR